MKHIVFLALICATMCISCSKGFRKAKPAEVGRTSKPAERIDFTVDYREFFKKDSELMHKKHAAFFLSDQVEFIGYAKSQEDSIVFFNNNYLIEGEFIHLVIPNDVPGRIKMIEGHNAFWVQFDVVDSIRLLFILSEELGIYKLNSLDINHHPFPAGVLEKYELAYRPDGFLAYLPYAKSNFYFVSGREFARLQVLRKQLPPVYRKARGIR